MADERPVDLSAAWFWVCPNCRSENFLRPPPSTALELLSDEDLRRLLNLDPWESVPDIADGAFELVPDYVKCQVCAHEFCARPTGLDPDEGMDDPPVVPDVLPSDF